jgi:hypothetical protein
MVASAGVFTGTSDPIGVLTLAAFAAVPLVFTPGLVRRAARVAAPSRDRGASSCLVVGGDVRGVLLRPFAAVAALAEPGLLDVDGFVAVGGRAGDRWRSGRCQVRTGSRVRGVVIVGFGR